MKEKIIYLCLKCGYEFIHIPGDTRTQVIPMHCSKVMDVKERIVEFDQREDKLDKINQVRRLLYEAHEILDELRNAVQWRVLDTSDEADLVDAYIYLARRADENGSCAGTVRKGEVQ